jgi:hypothetical protein
MKDHLKVCGILATFATIVTCAILYKTFAALLGLGFVACAVGVVGYIFYSCILSLVRKDCPYDGYY